MQEKRIRNFTEEQKAKRSAYNHKRMNDPARREDLLRRAREATRRYRASGKAKPAKTWAERSPESKKRWLETMRNRDRDIVLAQKYKVEVKLIKDLRAKQNGLCAVCDKFETKVNAKGQIALLCIDHDHVTGAVRELLCDNCNCALGRAEDSVMRLKALAKYLSRHGKALS